MTSCAASASHRKRPEQPGISVAPWAARHPQQSLLFFMSNNLLVLKNDAASPNVPTPPERVAYARARRGPEKSLNRVSIVLQMETSDGSILG
jgi:hypothetical protein